MSHDVGKATEGLEFILQPFFRFSYVTSFSLNLPGEPPMPQGSDTPEASCGPTEKIDMR